jgi:hypothetical protein
VPTDKADSAAGDPRDRRRLSRCPGREGAKPASLVRYKASIAKIHQLLDLKDPTQAEVVTLRLRAIRREKGIAQAQARALRFKGPVKNIERDKPRGINVRGCCQSNRTWPDIREFLSRSLARWQANEGNLKPTREGSRH